MSVSGPDPPAEADRTDRRELAVFISIRTILLVGVAVALAWALASVGHVLLLIFVSIFSVAVLSPVVDFMQRRLPWSRAACSTLLVIGIVVLTAVALLILSQPIIDGVRDFNDNLPRTVDEARHTSLGGFINGGSNSLDHLKSHASDIAGGVAKVSGGIASVGVSAFGVVTLAFSVTFLTLFGLIDEPRVRASIGGLMYRDRRERFDDVTDRIVITTSRYMLGNL